MYKIMSIILFLSLFLSLHFFPLTIVIKIQFKKKKKQENNFFYITTTNNNNNRKSNFTSIYIKFKMT